MADFRHEKDGGKFALEVTDVSVDVFGDVFDSFGFDFGAEELGFSAENGTFVFEFRELEIEGAGPSETRGEAFVDGFNLGREAIASDDDLFVELIEIVKDVEEFFLGLFLADDELEIVDDEDVEFAEFKIEFFTFTEFYGVDKIGVEMRNRGVEDFQRGVFSQKFIADGLDEVGFAEARAAIEEERVIAAARGVDDTASGGNGEIVIRTDDEVIEGVFRVKTRFAGLVGFEILGIGFNASFDRVSRITSRNFARADTGTRGRLDVERDVFYLDIVILEGVADEITVAVIKLFNMKRIFNTNVNFAVGSRN